MRRVLDAILPRGAAWVPVVGGGFDALLNGLGDYLETLRTVLGSLANIRKPQSTIILDDLEREYGIVNDDGISDILRRLYLEGVKYTPVGLGTAEDVQIRLRAAGFRDVFVYQNNPLTDPESFILGPGPAVELIVNGELAGHPDDWKFPQESEFWPFIFYIAGVRSDAQGFIDWNMEYSGALDWPAGDGGVITKTSTVKQSGLRSLLIAAVGATVTDQHMLPPGADNSVLSFYRMDQDTTITGTRVPGLTARNLLIDGDMNQTGVAAYTAVTATLTKENADPYSGRFSLRVLGTGGAVGWARQARIINGRDYTLTGRARSIDLSASPRSRDTGATRWTGTASGSWQTISVSWTASATGDLDLGSDTADGSVEFDDMRLIDDNFMFPGATPSNLTDVFTPFIEGVEFNGSTSFADVADDGIQNGDMGAAGGWGIGANWAIAAGVATYFNAGVGTSNLTQTGANMLALLLVPGGLYRVTFTTANFAGGASVQVNLGGTAGTVRTTNATFVEYVRAGTGNSVDFIAVAGPAGSGFDLDDVLVELIDEALWHENITFETVFKYDAVVGVSKVIVSNSDLASYFRLQVTNGEIVFTCVVGATGREVKTAIAVDRYHHIVVARGYDGTNTTLDLYVDGVLEDTGTWAGAPDITSWYPFLFGRITPTGGNYFDGIAADHFSFYADAKDQTWVTAQFAAYQAALLAGPHAAQILSPEVVTARTLTAAVWAMASAPGSDSLPVILARLPSGAWDVAFVGDPFSVDPLGLQAASFSLPDGITEARLYCKNAVTGSIAVDDMAIANIDFVRYEVPLALKDKFIRLILGSKPLHSWAGLFVDYI